MKQNAQYIQTNVRLQNPIRMHYTPPNLRAFLSGDRRAALNRRDLGPWPLYLLTAIVGLLTVPDTLFEITRLSYFQGWTLPLGGSWAVKASLAAAFLGGLRVVYVSLQKVFEGLLGADIAVAIASIAAIVLGETWVAAEVVFIALLGECLEGFIYARATREIGRMLDLAPQLAHVMRGGVEVNVPIDEVLAGEMIVIRPGERVPVDGLVHKGESAVDQSPLTGESLPIRKEPGLPVFAGTLNQFGMLEVRAERVGGETTLGQVLKLVAEAQRNKAPLERLADRYARWFLPLVLLAAALTFVFTNWQRGGWSTWNPTLAVLVVACPCALILATPAAVLAALAWLAKRGVILKGSASLERIASIDSWAFDKTGTLTTGSLTLQSIVPLGPVGEDELLRLAASAEARSEHVLGKLLVREARQRGLELLPIESFQAQPGLGVVVTLSTGPQAVCEVVVGNSRLLAKLGIEPGVECAALLSEFDAAGAIGVLVAIDGQIRGVLGAGDTVRQGAAGVLAELRALGMRRLAMVTGDRQAAANHIAATLGGFDAVVAGQLPAEKAAWLADWRGARGAVAMVGDGINDAPALATSDVGLALGGIGSDLASEAGDIVLLGDPLAPLPGLVRMSRQLVRVIHQNIVIFAFGVNATAIVLANLGLLSPVAGAFYHLAGSVLVLLNSMRLLWFESWHELWLGRWLSNLDRAAERISLSAAVDFFEIHGRRVLKIAAALLALAWAGSNIHVIGPEERAVVTRYGRFRTELGPGLIWRMPPPFETVTRARPAEIRAVTIGLFTGGPANVSGEDQSRGNAGNSPAVIEWDTVHDSAGTAPNREESLLLTGDEVLVEVAAAVNYRIAEHGLRDYLFSVDQPEAVLKNAAEHALRVVAAKRPLDALLTADRARLEAEALAELRILARDYRLGLEILDVSIGDLHPPLEVVPAYRDVASALEDRQTYINKAEAAYHESVLLAGGERLVGELARRRQNGDPNPDDMLLADWQDLLAQAGGQAAQTREGALEQREKRIQTSAGDAARFRLRQAAYRQSPDLTGTRLFWESLERALAGRPLWILDPRVVGRRSLFLTDPGALPPLALPPAADPLAPAVPSEAPGPIEESKPP